MSMMACQSRYLFVDGNFNCCPRAYKQILVVFSFCADHDMYLPVSYVLIQSKHPQSYVMSLYAVKDVCFEDGYDLSPQFVGTDFELALFNSVNIVFPKTTVVPIYFHFTKALWENAARRGLRKSAFIEQTKKLVAMVKCLSFTPLDKVMEKFLWIKNCFDGPEFDGFLKYVEKVWLSETP